MAKIRKIVVPTDFSEASRKVIAHASAMASSHGAEILLLHAIPPTVYPTYRMSRNRGFPNMSEQMESSARARLEEFEKQLGTHLNARLFVRTGEPFREVAKLVEEEQADLIAIATHGHTGIKHAILGSTAEKIVRSASVPVLTIRQDEDDPAVQPLELRRIIVPTGQTAGGPTTRSGLFRMGCSSKSANLVRSPRILSTSRMATRGQSGLAIRRRRASPTWTDPTGVRSSLIQPRNSKSTGSTGWGSCSSSSSSRPAAAAKSPRLVGSSSGPT